MIVLREKHSQIMKNQYFCSVRIRGKLVEPEDFLVYTDIRFKLAPVLKDSSSALIFERPVNLTFIKDNFDAIFDVYVKNNTFRIHNTTTPLDDIEVTHLSEDN